MKTKIQAVLVPVILLCILLLKSNVVHPLVSPLIVLLLAGIIVWRLNKIQELRHANSKDVAVLYTIAFLFSSVLLFYASWLFSNNPIDIAKSDIIPLLNEVYYKRFINGEFVYNRVLGYDYINWIPNYLPMHWLPFVPAFYFNIDPRYVPLIIFFVVQWMYVRYITKFDESLLIKSAKVVAPYILLTIIMYKQTTSFVHTVELLIVSYYLIIAYGLLRRNAYVLAFGIACAVLSRYAIVFFIPMHLYYEWSNKQTNFLIHTYGIVALLVLFIYIIPFLFHQPDIFFEGAAA
jgi:hypothetical protein